MPWIIPTSCLAPWCPPGPGIAIHVYELSRPRPRFYVARLPAPAGSEPHERGRLEEPPVGGCESGTVRLTATVPNERRYAVEVRGAGILVVRDSYARGWRATVDRRAVPWGRAWAGTWRSR
jgi:hypothetical protein